jgi:hypothetical protein
MEPRTHWTGLAIALLVIGLLILVPSGLCTALFGAGALFSIFSGDARDAMSTLSMVTVIGGIPVAIGAVLVFAAFRLRRKG